MLKGLYCKKREQVVTFNECLECSKDAEVTIGKDRYVCDIFPEFIQFVIKENEHEHSSNVSVTQLLGCSRKAYLSRVCDYSVAPEDLWYRFRGSIIHLLMEQFKVEDSIVEGRFKKEFNGITVSGRIDRIDTRRKTITDYKSIQSVKFDRTLMYGNSKVFHQLQLNLYRWLIAEKFDIDKLVIQYIGADRPMKKTVILRDPEKDKGMKACFAKLQLLGGVWGMTLKEAVFAKKVPPIEDTWECKGYCDVAAECKAVAKQEAGFSKHEQEEPCLI
jgi:hypothetical protein